MSPVWLLVPVHSVVLPKMLVGQAINQIIETLLVKSPNRQKQQIKNIGKLWLLLPPSHADCKTPSCRRAI